MQIQNRPTVRPAARLAAAAPAQAVAPAAPPKKAQAPAVKAQAQGGIKRAAQIIQGGAGLVGGGMGGLALGYAAWFMAGASGMAISGAVIGLGVVACAALGGYVGWKNGSKTGDDLESGFKK